MTYDDDFQPSSDIDEFLQRAVERQIAEQRALRESLDALTDAVDGMAADGPAVDPNDLADRVRAATRTAVDPIITEMRVLTNNILSAVQRSTTQSSGDDGNVKRSIDALSLDMEGIAQALIDLNAGLRDWASNVDRNITGIRDSVEEARTAAIATAAESSDTKTMIVPAEVADGEIVADGPAPRGDIEKRLKESIELSLYLADQIEEFDRLLRGMGDLPQKLEGVVAQGVRRTLTARTKLDSEAATVLDDAVASLEDYNERITKAVAGFADSEATLRKLGMGQAELAKRLDQLYDAVHELASGRGGAAARLTKPKTASRSKPAAPKKAAKAATSKRSPRKKKPSDDASTD